MIHLVPLFLLFFTASSLSAQAIYIEQLETSANDSKKHLELKITNWETFMGKDWVASIQVYDPQRKLLYQKLDTTGRFAPHWYIPYSCIHGLPEGRHSVQAEVELWLKSNPTQKAKKTGRSCLIQKNYLVLISPQQPEQGMKLSLPNWNDRFSDNKLSSSARIRLCTPSGQTLYTLDKSFEDNLHCFISYWDIPTLPTGNQSLYAEVEWWLAAYPQQVLKQKTAPFVIHKRLDMSVYIDPATENINVEVPALGGVKQWNATLQLTDNQDNPVCLYGGDCLQRISHKSKISRWRFDVADLAIPNGKHQLKVWMQVSCAGSTSAVPLSQSISIDKQIERWMWETTTVNITDPVTSDVSILGTNTPDYYWLVNGKRHSQYRMPLPITLAANSEFTFEVWDADVAFDDLEGKGSSVLFRQQVARQPDSPIDIPLYNESKKVGYATGRAWSNVPELFTTTLQATPANNAALGEHIALQWQIESHHLDTLTVYIRDKTQGHRLPFWINDRIQSAYKAAQPARLTLLTIQMPRWCWAADSPPFELVMEGRNGGTKVLAQQAIERDAIPRRPTLRGAPSYRYTLRLDPVQRLHGRFVLPVVLDSIRLPGVNDDLAANWFVQGHQPRLSARFVYRQCVLLDTVLPVAATQMVLYVPIADCIPFERLPTALRANLALSLSWDKQQPPLILSALKDSTLTPTITPFKRCTLTVKELIVKGKVPAKETLLTLRFVNGSELLATTTLPVIQKKYLWDRAWDSRREVYYELLEGEKVTLDIRLPDGTLWDQLPLEDTTEELLLEGRPKLPLLRLGQRISLPRLRN